jgi:hypothetical protein
LALGDIRLPCGTGLPERPAEPNKSIDSTVEANVGAVHETDGDNRADAHSGE